MNLEPGLRITEHVELRFPIGDGGMGRVWAAEHMALGRPVAVKFVALALTDDAGAVERFALEGHTMARLQTAYAPQVFDCGTLADGTPFIVMELLEGVSLHARLLKEGRLSLAQTVQLVRQIGSALASAHALGIIHRDIKPENIILVPGEDDAFTAKVLDFGIAKAGREVGSAALTEVGTTLGTPSYMSPEQLLGATAVDSRADLWSTAVVAYCCLTGELPFVGDTFGAVCLAIHNGVVIDPSNLRPGLPPALDAWFRKAWTPNLDGRFASAGEMAEAFAHACADGLSLAPVAGDAVAAELPTHEPTEGPSARRAPETRAHFRARRSLGAITVLALAAALVFASWTLGGPVNGPATEKRAAGVARAVERWTASHALRSPFVAIAEPSSGASTRSADPLGAVGPTPSAVPTPVASAPESPSGGGAADERIGRTQGL